MSAVRSEVDSSVTRVAREAAEVFNWVAELVLGTTHWSYARSIPLFAASNSFVLGDVLRADVKSQRSWCILEALPDNSIEQALAASPNSSHLELRDVTKLHDFLRDDERDSLIESLLGRLSIMVPAVRRWAVKPVFLVAEGLFAGTNGNCEYVSDADVAVLTMSTLPPESGGGILLKGQLFFTLDALVEAFPQRGSPRQAEVEEAIRKNSKRGLRVRASIT